MSKASRPINKKRLGFLVLLPLVWAASTFGWVELYISIDRSDLGTDIAAGIIVGTLVIGAIAFAWVIVSDIVAEGWTALLNWLHESEK